MLYLATGLGKTVRDFDDASQDAVADTTAMAGVTFTAGTEGETVDAFKQDPAAPRTKQEIAVIYAKDTAGITLSYNEIGIKEIADMYRLKSAGIPGTDGTIGVAASPYLNQVTIIGVLRGLKFTGTTLAFACDGRPEPGTEQSLVVDGTVQTLDLSYNIVSRTNGFVEFTESV